MPSSRWGLLLVVCGTIVASIDPELAEVYLGDRRLLGATVALAVLTIVALVALRPEAAAEDFIRALSNLIVRQLVALWLLVPSVCPIRDNTYQQRDIPNCHLLSMLPP